MTYLGVVIDNRLTMIKHISNNINKAKKTLGLIHYAAGQHIMLSSLVRLMKTTVLSRVLTGVWSTYLLNNI